MKKFSDGKHRFPIKFTVSGQFRETFSGQISDFLFSKFEISKFFIKIGKKYDKKLEIFMSYFHQLSLKSNIKYLTKKINKRLTH